MSKLSDFVNPRRSYWLFLGFFVSLQAFALPPCKKFEGAGQQKLLRAPYDAPLGVPGLNRKYCEKEWTVLVYMAADNNLSDFAHQDLLEMESPVWDSDLATASTSHIDVVTQLDTLGSEGVFRRQMYSYEKTLLQKNEVLSPVVELLPEHNSADPQNLLDFLRWGRHNFPSKRIMLVIWGHGQGWSSGGGVYGGVAFDDESQAKMSIRSMSHALHRFVEEENKGRPIDVLASDACLMQSFEVLSEMVGDFRNLKTQPIEFIVGSTEKQSALGLPYHSILHYLNELYRNGVDQRDVSSDAYLLASKIPYLMKQNLVRGGGDLEAQKSLTLSSVSVAQFKQSLIPNFFHFARLLNDYLHDDSNDLIEVLELTNQLMAYEGGNRDMGAWAHVLGDYFQARLREDTSYEEIVDVISGFDAALSATVIATSLGSRYSESREQLYLLGHKALSLWMPRDLFEYELRREDFSKSNLYSFVPHGYESNPWLDLQDYLYNFSTNFSTGFNFPAFIRP